MQEFLHDFFYVLHVMSAHAVVISSAHAEFKKK
jgi:hypothetical protein